MGILLYWLISLHEYNITSNSTPDYILWRGIQQRNQGVCVYILYMYNSILFSRKKEHEIKQTGMKTGSCGGDFHLLKVTESKDQIRGNQCRHPAPPQQAAALLAPAYLTEEKYLGTAT